MWRHILCVDCVLHKSQQVLLSVSVYENTHQDDNYNDIMVHQDVSIITAYVAQSLAAGTLRRRMETETTTPAFHSRLRRSFKKKTPATQAIIWKININLHTAPKNTHEMDLYKKSTLDSKQSKNRSKEASTTQCVADFQNTLKRGFYNAL